jgi:hypothetical protein
MRSFIFCTHPQILLGRSNQAEWGGRDMWHTWDRRENCARFWWKSQKERDHLKDQVIDGRMGSAWVLGRLAGGVYSGSSWLRIGTSGGLLWIQWWTFGFWCHGISSLVQSVLKYLLQINHELKYLKISQKIWRTFYLTKVLCCRLRASML